MSARTEVSGFPTVHFGLPDGSARAVRVTRLLNAGYTGRAREEVAAHIAELAELGIPAPSVTPAVYPIAPYLAAQVDEVPVQHGRTSGEAEWALVVAGDQPEDLLITAACDHTDRALEVHGVAWSKNAAPDVLGRQAWRLTDIADHFDRIRLRGWVFDADGTRQLIQDATLDALLPPRYWLDTHPDLLTPGTVLLSGTTAMVPGVDQFADRWMVELADPRTGETITVGYTVRRAPDPIG